MAEERRIENYARNEADIGVSGVVELQPQLLNGSVEQRGGPDDVGTGLSMEQGHAAHQVEMCCRSVRPSPSNSTHSPVEIHAHPHTSVLITQIRQTRRPLPGHHIAVINQWLRYTVRASHRPALTVCETCPSLSF